MGKACNYYKYIILWVREMFNTIPKSDRNLLDFFIRLLDGSVSFFSFSKHFSFKENFGFEYKYFWQKLVNSKLSKIYKYFNKSLFEFLTLS